MFESALVLCAVWFHPIFSVVSELSDNSGFLKRIVGLFKNVWTGLFDFYIFFGRKHCFFCLTPLLFGSYATVVYHDIEGSVIKIRNVASSI